MTQTLEESAKIFVNNRFSKQISGDNTYPDIYASKESIIESHILFAKWQQEQSKEMEKEQMIEFACQVAESSAMKYIQGKTTRMIAEELLTFKSE
jgi:hypothetical protein